MTAPSTIPGNPQARVPEHLIRDFDIYNLGADGSDYFRTIHRLHEEGYPDVFWTPRHGGHWIALRGDAIATVFKDPASFSSKRINVPVEANFDGNALLPLMSDPPEHAVYRKVLTGLFAATRMNKLEMQIREFTAETVSGLRPKGGCEFVGDFSKLVPIVVFLRLLDLPLDHRDRLLALASRIMRPSEGGANVIQLIVDYLAPIIEQRQSNPQDDVISQLTLAVVNGRHLNSSELLGVASTVLLGGLDTIAATLGFIANYLATDSTFRQRLIDNPADIRFAVEELLRRFSPTTHGRMVTRDIDLFGAPLKANDQIQWTASMYNLDHRIFPNPMTVDLERARTPPPLSFGLGIHACLGSFLSRIELRVFIEEWLMQIPDFCVKQGELPRYRPGIVVALERLPLVWQV